MNKTRRTALLIALAATLFAGLASADPTGNVGPTPPKITGAATPQH